MISTEITKIVMKITMKAREIIQEYSICPQHHEIQAVDKFIEVLREIVDEHKKG